MLTRRHGHQPGRRRRGIADAKPGERLELLTLTIPCRLNRAGARMVLVRYLARDRQIRTEKGSMRALTLVLFRRIIDPLLTISSVPQTL